MTDLLERKPPAEPTSVAVLVTGKLMRWLSDDELARALLPFDIELDLLQPNQLRIDVSLAFNHIVVPIDTGVRYVELYLGYEGVRVEVHARGGAVVDHRKHESISVNYSKTVTHQRVSEISLAPKVARKDPAGGEASAELGGARFEAGVTSAFTTELHCEERVLSPTLFGRKVRWLFDRPKVDSALRDFLDGNLHLFAICAWDDPSKRTGLVRVNPSGVSFFDENRAKLRSKRKSLLMEFLLRSRRSLKALDRRGQEVLFELQGRQTGP